MMRQLLKTILSRNRTLMEVASRASWVLFPSWKMSSRVFWNIWNRLHYLEFFRGVETKKQQCILKTSWYWTTLESDEWGVRISNRGISLYECLQQILRWTLHKNHFQVLTTCCYIFMKAIHRSCQYFSCLNIINIAIRLVRIVFLG